MIRINKFMKRFGFGFKTNMILLFSTIVVIPIIIIVFAYSSIYQNIMFENMLKEKYNKINYISSTVNSKIDEAEKFLIGFSYNKNLRHLLIKNYEGKNQMTIDIVEFNKSIQAFLRFGSVNNIDKIVVVGENGVELQIGNDTTVIDTNVLNNNYLEKNLEKENYKLVLAPDKYRISSLTFPRSKNVVDIFSGKIIGEIVIFYNVNFISDVLKESNMSKSDQVFVVNSSGQCLAHSTPNLNGKDLSKLDYVSAALNSEQEVGYIEYDINNIKRLVVYKKDIKKNIVVFEYSTIEDYYQEKTVALKIALWTLFFSAIICTIIVVLISTRLSKPIKSIMKHIEKITSGSLEINKSTESYGELGIIGNGINEMVVSINGLINETIKKESEKKEMEFKMLQSQINPHFLYNTLNSIKWLATMQNSTQIVEITSSLSRLLKNISKGTSEMIALYDEFIFIDDYVNIQNIRYSDKIKLVYNIKNEEFGNEEFGNEECGNEELRNEEPRNEELGDAKILKFTLQPIIENAIFHGIVAKDGEGTIEISAQKINKYLVIKIKDDGVGMSEETIKNIFTCEKPIDSKSINSIGIKNVDERLKLYYGDEFGLKIRSEKNCFTEITINIPYCNQ